MRGELLSAPTVTALERQRRGGPVAVDWRPLTEYPPPPDEVADPTNLLSLQRGQPGPDPAEQPPTPPNPCRSNAGNPAPGFSVGLGSDRASDGQVICRQGRPRSVVAPMRAGEIQRCARPDDGASGGPRSLSPWRRRVGVMSTTTNTAASTASRPWPALWGRSLRFVLVAHLMEHEQLTVAELGCLLSSDGHGVSGRLSKVISDSLRWEIRRGRVERIGRGRYRYCGAPPTTARRIALFGRRCQAWARAVLTGRQPEPTPEDPRRPMWWPIHDAQAAPWDRMGWLWVT